MGRRSARTNAGCSGARAPRATAARTSPRAATRTPAGRAAVVRTPGSTSAQEAVCEVRRRGDRERCASRRRAAGRSRRRRRRKRRCAQRTSSLDRRFRAWRSSAHTADSVRTVRAGPEVAPPKSRPQGCRAGRAGHGDAPACPPGPAMTLARGGELSTAWRHVRCAAPRPFRSPPSPQSSPELAGECPTRSTSARFGQASTLGACDRCTASMPRRDSLCGSSTR
jgi:hypothetical protein